MTSAKYAFTKTSILGQLRSFSIRDNLFEYDEKYFGPSPESYGQLVKLLEQSDFKQQVLNRYNSYINAIQVV